MIVSVRELARRLGDPQLVVVDCRASLGDPDAGLAAYRSGHVAGAVCAHLDQDLSGPVLRGRTGRHPLPQPDALAATFGGWGIDEQATVVAYDDAGGALAAARLWWLARWLGHERVAVLDGGWAAWLAHGGAVKTGDERRPSRQFVARVRDDMVIDAAGVDSVRSDSSWRVIDARAPERYRGDIEPIDPVAGRIPGAHNAPHTGNLSPDGTFLPAGELRARIAPIVGSTDPHRVVCYCGSGVTAAHDVLALEIAGFSGARLYPGSWSEWILDPARPVETG